jgi:hypothetical protein
VFGGTGLALYQRRIDALCGQPLRYYGTYVSTEAPIGFPVRSYDGESLYYLNPNIIVNFSAPSSETLIGIKDLEVGKIYQVYPTTANGFLHYPLKDEIQVVSIAPHFTFKVIGRSKGGLNLATEKITEERLDYAVGELSKRLQINGLQYFVLPYHTGGLIGYEFILFAREPDGKGSRTISSTSSNHLHWETHLDAILSEQNQDYRESRAQNVLGPVRVKVLADEQISSFFRDNTHKGQIKLNKVFSSVEALSEELKNRFGTSFNLNEIRA